MKKIYLALLAMTLGLSANAQRNLKLDFQIIKPIYDTNIVTGSTLKYQYRVTNNSATAADSIQAGDTVKFFDPSCAYDATSTATIKFTNYVYFVASASLPKGSSINVTPTTALAFTDINTLAELATLPTLSFKSKPFTNNKQYAWFTILYSVAKPTANIGISSLTGLSDTGRIWINKSSGINETFSNSKVESIKTYPNPASTTLSFEYTFEQKENGIAKVLDVAGRTILVKEFENNFGEQKFDLDINSLNTGSYILQFIVGDKNLMNKFNVQK